MLNINATITNKSQLKQKVKKFCGPFLTQPWAVLYIRMGRFGHKRGPFWTRTMGRFGPWAVLVISRVESKKIL